MDISERLKTVRGLIRQEDFAATIGVKKNTVGRWERGEQIPDVEEVNKVLVVFPDINPVWLLTGEGKMLLGDTPIAVDPGVQYAPGRGNTTQLDEALLQSVLEAVEEYLESINGHLPATKKAQLVVMLYEMCSESAEKKIDKAAVIRLVKLAA